MGFWERMNANPADNLDSLKRSQAQLAGMRKQQSRSRQAAKQAAKTIEDLRSEIDDLRADLQSQQQAHSDELDRLTRCLFANRVIEPADLAAMLPESTEQDD